MLRKIQAEVYHICIHLPCWQAGLQGHASLFAFRRGAYDLQNITTAFAAVYCKQQSLPA